MRYLFLIIFSATLFLSCKKDKFTTAPQITYKSVSPNFVDASVANGAPANVIFEITDSEGDIGFKAGSDTSFVYLKNLLVGTEDSVPFPNLSNVAGKNFQAEISVSLEDVTRCKSLPGNPIHVDSLFFEVYVKDFKKNKSNVIVTGDPVLFRCR